MILHYAFPWKVENLFEDHFCYLAWSRKPTPVPVPMYRAATVTGIHLEQYRDKHNRLTYTEIL